MRKSVAKPPFDSDLLWTTTSAKKQRKQTDVPNAKHRRTSGGLPATGKNESRLGKAHKKSSGALTPRAAKTSSHPLPTGKAIKVKNSKKAAPLPKVEKLTKETLAKEKEAIEDVYNYCARHMAVPRVMVEELGHLGTKMRNVYQITIQLAEHDISVSALVRGYPEAVVAAAVKFKAAAETRTAQSEMEILAEGQNVLSADNADKFPDWLKTHRPFNYVIQADSGPAFSEAQVFSEEDSTEPLSPKITGKNATVAKKLALLCAAINIAKSDKDTTLLERFGRALEEGNGTIMRPVSPISLQVSQESMAMIRKTLLSSSAKALTNIDSTAVSESEHQHRHSTPRQLSHDQKLRVSQQLSEAYQGYLRSEGMATIRNIKAELPMNLYKPQVRQIVEDNVYSIIIGATGSGKTTQVPQILLEQYYRNGNGADCNIICTQPRRIAAISVASRVADEMGPGLSDHVGHHVRFDVRLPRQGGSVTYCTTGVLLQQLQAEPERIFDRASHLIIDEVHERDKIIDFTLTILKKAVAERLACGLKVPKITLMSATLDTELFANYFKNPGPDGVQTNAPVLSVPGRTFPVVEKHLDDILRDLRKNYSSRDLEVLQQDKFTQVYLGNEQAFARGASPTQDEDVIIDWKSKSTALEGHTPQDSVIPYGLTASTIAHVLRTTSDGAILVFLPGLDEMQRVEKLITEGPVLGIDLTDKTKYKIYLLHSSIPDSQKTVFQPIAPNMRKIILSTNIGETSITIPDVQHVIDTGKVRQTQYDHVKRISALQTAWISKSNAKQRAGRAGRVQNGHYLALYTKARHESLPAVGLPELLRSDLQTTCLSIKASVRGIDVAEFLAAAIEPPSPASIAQAIKQLIDMGALTHEQNFTALGKLLSSLPVHPALGKMMVLGVVFRCLDPIMIIGAAAEERNLFVMSPDIKAESTERKASFAAGSESDHLAMYNAFSEVRKCYIPGDPRSEKHAKNIAWENCMHFGAFKAIYGAAQQMEQIFSQAGLFPLESSKTMNSTRLFGGKDLNVHSDKTHIVKAILLAGMQPNIAIAAGRAGAGRTIWRSASEANILLPLTSVLSRKPPRQTQSNGQSDRTLLAYTSLVKSADGSTTYLRDTSTVSPLAVALFSNALEHPVDTAILTANSWLPIFPRSEGLASKSTASWIMEFRRMVQNMLAGAFSDLAVIDSRQHARVTSRDQAVVDSRIYSPGMDAEHWRDSGREGRGVGMHDFKPRSEVIERVVSVLDNAEREARSSWQGLGRGRREPRPGWQDGGRARTGGSGMDRFSAWRK
ncbi:P-loop containing nucleoside triphosphate hydrolase protein [Xylariales sp. AK1849]|nr:P-loop containing nucleoside triphosphate hydrolase protein [Xylariales sp. AK1849]